MPILGKVRRKWSQRRASWCEERLRRAADAEETISRKRRKSSVSNAKKESKTKMRKKDLSIWQLNDHW